MMSNIALEKPKSYRQSSVVSASVNNFNISKPDSNKTYSLKDFASRLFCLKSEDLIEVSNETICMAIYLEDKIRKISKSNNLWWSDPLVNIDGEFILFEWWHQSRKISFYSSSDYIDFIQVWGADIDKEMNEETLELDNDRHLDSEKILSLWQWIVS
jgi:hypothetical protein